MVIKKIFICTVTCFELRDINLRVQNGWDIYRTVYQCSINYKIFLMIACPVDSIPCMHIFLYNLLEA